MKKDDWIGLGVCVLIGLVAAGITGWQLCQKRLSVWRPLAREAFHAALMEEIQKRNTGGVYMNFSGNYNLPADSAGHNEEPVRVQLESEYGRKDFWIPYAKHANRVEPSSVMQGICSYLLHVSPLDADSLNRSWNRRLEAMGFPGTAETRISVTDWWERDSYAYSADSLSVSGLDSLTTFYLGLRCEVGTTGYLHTPWRMMLSWRDGIGLGAVVALCILLFLVHGCVYRLCRRLFVREKIVVVEKAIPVTVVCESRPPVCQLEEGVYFETGSRLLKKGDSVVKLMPLSAKLLQGFLDAKEHRLPNDEILRLLWPDGTGTLDKLHQNIKRLRHCLSQISICTIEHENFAYRFIIPHSIEENPVE